MLLKARWVLPVATPPIEDGAVRVTDGRVEAVGPAAELRPGHAEEPVRDFGRAILLPGLVNAHAHLELTLLRGLLPELELPAWIRGLLALRRGPVGDGDLEFACQLGAAELLLSGFTSVGDCTATGHGVRALSEAGLRGVAYLEALAPTAGAVRPALDRWRASATRLCESASPRVRLGLSPHAPYTSCPEMLRACADLASAEALPLSIHAAESAAEIEFLAAGRGPLWELLRSEGHDVAAPGGSPVDLLEEAGWLALDCPVQLVHLCRAAPADLRRLAAAAGEGRSVTAVACPRSNARLGNGLPDLAAWERAGLAWGLGTDGSPSVGPCDPFAEMRAARSAWLQRAGSAARATPSALIEHATAGSARSLGLADGAGTLAPGRPADLIVVEAGRAGHGHGDAPAAVLVEAATTADVRLVMIEGEVLAEEGRLTRVDGEALAREAEERASALRKRLA